MCRAPHRPVVPAPRDSMVSSAHRRYVSNPAISPYHNVVGTQGRSAR
jgi:hypothetical protein